MQEVGRYQIDEMSGEGAMARVYKAYDPKIDRTLAIKALKSHLLADDEYRARFLREAKGAGHPLASEHRHGVRRGRRGPSALYRDGVGRRARRSPIC